MFFLGFGIYLTSSVSVFAVPSPVANFTINGGGNLTATVGDIINYSWSSANGTGISSGYHATWNLIGGNVTYCGGGFYSGSWATADGSSGGTDSTAAAAIQDGCTYYITYTVDGQPGSSPASDTVGIYVSVYCPTGYSSNGTNSCTANSYGVSWYSNTGGSSSGVATCTYGSTVVPTCTPDSGYYTSSCANFTCSTTNGFIPYFTPFAPTITTPTVSAVTGTTATLGATVTGGAAISARGTCWGTSASPLTNCVAEGGTSVAAFTHSRTGLPGGTLIYYRGYVTNAGGTTYSADGSFTTSNTAPTVTTPTAASITATGATLGATVSANGGSAITARGTCWGTTATPLTNCVAEGGTSVAAFSHARTGMATGTLIYYRGYATNAVGTSYSSDATFTTLAPPTLTTPTSSSVSDSGATLGATIVSSGGSAVTARGTCWGTTASPLTNCSAEGGTSVAAFTHSRTGMASSTLYYYRGYATNAIGTSYSPDSTFTTNAVSGDCTGGTVTYVDSTGSNPRGTPYSGGYTVHTFTSSGTFTCSAANTVSYLVVGGGGAGGGSMGAGGGAGGMRTGSGFAVSAQAYSITVGAGGTGVSAAAGNSGGNSIFSTITSTGGGGGGAYPSGIGAAGGSGGGGQLGGAVGTGTAGQGNNGGGSGAGWYAAGGGGGAGAVGGASVLGAAGNGGAGLSSSITGTATFYAGGGGGGYYSGEPASNGTGGSGIGGNGEATGNSGVGGAGSANTGSGGGGAGYPSGTGGAGGSGIVVIKYPTSSVLTASLPIECSGGTVTYTDTDGLNASTTPYTGGYTVHKFTSSGTLTCPAAVTASYLVVAGGGAGGGAMGSGGGAGGMRTGSGMALSAQAYTVTVGAGGTGTTGAGSSGGNSVFNGITSTGGGGGVYYTGGTYAGISGGSGSGGGPIGSSSGGTGTVGQGNAGGTGSAAGYSTGGGGGAGGVGGNENSGAAGNGGAGLSSSITGTATFYAGGGGGSGYYAAACAAGLGGSSIGGAGNCANNANGSAGAANTGSGGGGGGYSNGNGGAGGSGVVVVRYIAPLSGTTTIGTGNDPSSVTIGPGGAATEVDAFTLQTSSGSDLVSSIVVALANASSTSKLEVTSNDGLVVYGSTTNPTGATTAVTVSITATSTVSSYKLRITPKSQANLPVGTLGALYPVTASVSSWTSLKSATGTDTSNTTVTIDNLPPSVQGDDGKVWTSRASAADNNWTSVTYGNGLFVAVANTGSRNRVMTSPDGTTWTSRSSAGDYDWNAVTYGNGLFVAVGNSLFGKGAMYSSDGITWATSTTAKDNNWTSVAYGNGVFVAVSNTGSGDRVMTSSDGITWISRTSPNNNNWTSVTYGNSLFVAVANTGSGNRVMTSPDGITWTLRTSAADNSWTSVTYGNSLFVAVSNTGTGNRVMTSSDGVTWTSRASAADNNWTSVTSANGLFVAVADSGSGNRVMTSPDGITWTSQSSSSNNDWRSITYGRSTFVAVANFYITSLVMTSNAQLPVLIPGNATATISYTTSADADLSGILVLRSLATSTYATWNPSDKGSSVTLSNSNKTYTNTTAREIVRSTVGKSSGKWYWEVTVNTASPYINIGVARPTATLTNYLGSDSSGVGYEGAAGSNGIYTSGSNGYAAGTYAAGDIIGIRLDMDAGTVAFYKNNVLQNTVSGLSGTYYAAAGDGLAVTSATANFGQTSFTYSVPNGYNPGLYSVPTDTVYATWSNTDRGSGVSVSTLNLSATSTSGNQSIRSTISKTTGKYYFEFIGATSTAIGVNKSTSATSSYVGSDANGWAYASNGLKYNAGTGVAYGSTYTAGDIIGVKLDLDAGTLEFLKNNTSQGVAFTNVSGPVFIAAGSSTAAVIGTLNAGSSTFAYPVPSGYNAGFFTSGAFLTDVPVDGATYSVGNAIGNSVVACVDSSVTALAQRSCIASGLTNGSAYYFKIFAKDSYGNYSEGIIPMGSLIAPNVASTIEQSGFRFFASSTTAIPGTALSSQNTLATLTNFGDPFRLRMSFHVGSNALTLSARPMKLQYAVKVGTCDTSFTGESYADVTSITPISYYNVTTLTDGSLLGSQTDLTHSSDTFVDQSFVESNNFNNAQAAVPVGQDAKFDFSLYDNNAPSNTSYCIRAVNADGTTLNTYSFIPEVRTAQQVVQLANFLFRRDDGTDSTATSFTTENTAVVANFVLGDKVRLRLTLANQGTSVITKAYQLEYSSGSCTVWTPVPRAIDATTQDWRMDTSSYVADNVTTAALGGTTVPSNKAFKAGRLQTFNSATYPISLNSGEYTQIEYTIRSTKNATAFTPYCFRVTNVGDSADFVYSVTPQITITPTFARRQGGGSAVGQAAAAAQVIESIATTTVSGGTTSGSSAASSTEATSTNPQSQQSTTTPTKVKGGSGDVGAVGDARFFAHYSKQEGIVLGESVGPMCTDMFHSMKYGAADSGTQGEVSQLQYYLLTKGYFNNQVTGQFLSITKAAVKEYQKNNNLPVTGIVGKLTKNAMKNEGCLLP